MAMTRLALALGKFVQTPSRRVAAVRDAYLTALDASGGAEWMQSRIKPVPAYAGGAFAEAPHAIAPKRSVGSQFPQPRVRAAAAGAEMLLDDAIGAGWCALAADAAAADALGADGLPVFLLGRDLEDADGWIREWLDRFGADWVVLRPDRFVFATGAGAGEVPPALAALHRTLGRAGAAAPAAASEPALANAGSEAVAA
jgi:3-(3-hydroxy-phenyl)propionate hydroxylase